MASQRPQTRTPSHSRASQPQARRGRSPFHPLFWLSSSWTFTPFPRVSEAEQAPRLDVNRELVVEAEDLRARIKAATELNKGGVAAGHGEDARLLLDVLPVHRLDNDLHRHNDEGDDDEEDETGNDGKEDDPPDGAGLKSCPVSIPRTPERAARAPGVRCRPEELEGVEVDTLTVTDLISKLRVVFFIWGFVKVHKVALSKNRGKKGPMDFELKVGSATRLPK